MGFTDSLKKVIGIEEIEDDEIVTDQELDEARKKLAKEQERDTTFLRPQSIAKAETEIASTPKVDVSLGTSFPVKSEKRYSVTGTNSLKLILIEPKSFDECPKLVDSLKSRKPVIINLERLETETARKIFDFLSGATYALNGNVQKIANNIFIFTPENVAVAAEQSRATVTETEEKSPWR